MSARTEFQPEFSAKAGERPAYAGPNRRSTSPLDRLSRRLNRVCSTAVDPYQIAAMLESDGLNDRIALEEYGFKDVFELADALYKRVPGRPLSAMDTLKRSPASRAWLEVSKGLLFGLPGLLYPAVYALFGIWSTTLGLTFAAIAGWGWSQLMSHIAHRMINRGNAGGAARLLLGLAGLGVLGTVGLMLIASQFIVGGDFASAIKIAAVQMAYQTAASIVFVFERELWLFWAVLPGILINICYLVLGADAISPVIAAVAGCGSVVLALMAAYLCAVRAGTWQKKTKKGMALRLSDVMEAVPFVFYGAGCAAFIAFDTLQFWIVRPDFAPPALGFVIVPVVLSMGVLEWQLRRFRERGVELLARTQAPQVFSTQIRNAFLQALSSYALILVGLSLMAWVLTVSLGLDPLQTLMLLAANCALGVGFFAAFLLIGQNRIMVVLFALLMATIVRATGLFAPTLTFLPLDFAVYTLSSCAVFMALVLLAVRTEISTVSHYR
jgi:hypothetical protein